MRSTIVQRIAVTCLFFLSGLSSLIYQIVWQRALTQEIGVDSISMAFIVTIFIAGLGFGSLAGGVSTGKYKGDFVQLYGVIELAIGLFGVMGIRCIRFANWFIALFGGDSIIVDFLVNSVVIIIPVFLMGMTTPIILHLVKDRYGNLGRIIGIYYGANILGAAAGALLAGLVLIEAYGLQGATNIAAGVSILIAITFLSFASFVRRRTAEEPACTSSRPGIVATFPTELKIASIIFGFISLSYEIVLFRITSHYFSSYALVFPLMLSAYLLMMSLGNFLSGFLVDRISRETYLKYLMILLILAFGSTIIVLIFPNELLIRYNISQVSIKQAVVPLREFLVMLAAMTPILFISALFPVVTKVSVRDMENTGANTGHILFWYALGNTAGAYFTAIYLLDAVGTISTVLICLVLFTAGIVVLSRHVDKCRGGGGILCGLSTAHCVALVALLLGCWIALPGDYFYRFQNVYCDGKYPIEVIESRIGVHSIYKYNENFIVQINRVTATGIYTDIDRAVPYYVINYSRLLALCGPEYRPARILIIGLGPGTLPYALKEYDFVREIVVVEISPDVINATRKYADPKIVKSLRDPKIRLVVSDGRRFVQKARFRGEKFDIVQVSASSHEADSVGIGNIYSEDFFRRIKEILSPGGILVVPDIVAVAKAGLNVFHTGYQLSDFANYLFLTDRKINVPGEKTMPLWLASYYIARSPVDLSRKRALTGEEYQPLKLLDLHQDFLARYRSNTDDHPVLEYTFLQRLKGIKELPNDRVATLVERNGLRPSYVRMKVGDAESSQLPEAGGR